MNEKKTEELKTEELDQVVGGQKSQKQSDGVIDILVGGTSIKKKEANVFETQEWQNISSTGSNGRK